MPEAPAAPAPGKVDVQGTGRLVNPPVPRPVAAEPQVVESQGSITLNFVDADVRDVIRTVLGGTLGLNYVLDPQVRGTVTLQTSRPIPREATLATLENVLTLNGLNLVKTGEVYSVTPSKSAARGTAVPRSSSAASYPGEAFGIRVVPLRFTPAAEMGKILEPLVAPEAILRVDPARNLLILAGTQAEQRTMLDIVDIFDVDWMSGMSFAMLPLNVAKPDEVIADLERVFGKEEGGPGDGLVRFFPIERRNAVLVITSRPDYLEVAKQWVARLDVGDSDQPQLFVYRIKNGRAADLAAILSQVFSGTAAPPRTSALAPGLRPGRIVTPLRSSFGLQGGTQQTRSDGNALLARELPPGGTAAQAAPAPPSGPAPAARPGPASRAVPRPPGPAQAARVTALPRSEEDVRIIADEVNNALVILARPRTYRMIESALRRLDVVPLQVLIEATIAEVSLTNQVSYGVQWFFRARGDSKEGSITLSSSDGAVASTFPGFSYVFSSANDVKIVLDALEDVTDVKILSTPQVMVLDNHSAELRVGQQVPIATRSSVGTVTPDAPVVNQIEYRDTGTSLRVTPRVNASGLVSLDIDQEVSDAAQNTTSGIVSPQINQRRIQTSVVLHSGETIALGGLITETKNDINSGIPILKDIPVVGNLFGSTSRKNVRSELLVLISPRVVRNQEEARAVTDELRRKLRGAAVPIGGSGG